MNFSNPIEIDNLVWELRLADWDRGRDRALVDELFDGFSPFGEEYNEEYPNNANFNDLSAPKLANDASRQYYKAFFEPEPQFTIEVDFGPPHKRSFYADKVTKGINRRVRDNRYFLEARKSVFASAILHGAGIAMWDDQDHWSQRALGIGEAWLPGNTYRSLENLPFIALYRKYTGEMLRRMTRGPHVDPAWDMPLVQACLKWVDTEAVKLNSQSFPEIWSLEKQEQRLKENGGPYYADVAPTIDCIDFYYYDDAGRNSGWRRRIVLDTFGAPGTAYSLIGDKPKSPTRKIPESKGRFLYNPGDRKIANSLDEFIHFQFADASVVSPFLYHNRRGLGWLLYSVCHIQNRLRCKMTDAAFEACLQYLRAQNPADQERLSKVELVDKGVIPQGLNFVLPTERWQVPAALVQAVLSLNRQTMSDLSSGLVQDFQSEQVSDRETAARVNERMSASQAMLSGLLSMSYDLERFRDIEICRRFCVKDSRDKDVRSFRVDCLDDGVPEKALRVERWNVQPARTIGAGNKAMQIAIMDKVMSQYYHLLDPDAQTEVKRLGLAVTLDSYDRAARLVPDSPKVSDSVHDAELAFGTMMQGVPISLKQGVNHEDYVQTLLKLIGAVVARIKGSDNMGTNTELLGLQIAAGVSSTGQPITGNGAENHLGLLEQDDEMKSKVKEYRDALKVLMNEIKGFVQRRAEKNAAGENGANGQPQMDPKDLAKARAIVMHQDVKDKMAMRSHALKTAQKEVGFEQKLAQEQQQHQVDLANAAINSQAPAEGAFTE